MINLGENEICILKATSKWGNCKLILKATEGPLVQRSVWICRSGSFRIPEEQ